jgi:hypothetical protein
MMNEIKLAFSKGMQKKGQMGGLAGGVVLLGISAVVGIIMVSVYNSVFNGQARSSLNGSTRTVFENVPVFIGLLILLATVGGFMVGRK